MEAGHDEEKVLVRRFNTWRIIEHWVLIISFLVLAVTGLTQKFHALWISQWIIHCLGGIDASRFLHHMAGITFTVLILQHILVTSAGILIGKWAPSMLITVKDFQDALHNVKYYLGLERDQSLCGRYNYKEKFVYWLVLIGGIQMVATGGVLWFPVVAAKVLPGQFIVASKVMHTNEAMLIFLLIAIWHIYDSIFNPDVFPIDSSIFLGYTERDRTKRGYGLELQDVQGKGANAEQRSERVSTRCDNACWRGDSSCKP